MKNLNIIPLPTHIVVKPLPEPTEKEVGGIIVPVEPNSSPHLRGEVVAVNPKTNLSDSGLSIGATIIYPRYSGVKLEYESEDYIVMLIGEISVIVV